MVYAAIADVQAQVSLFVISASSNPTTAQVTGYILNCASELDAALASRGLAVPVTLPAWFLSDLIRLNAQGAAAMALMAAFPQEAGPGSIALGPTLWRTYQDRLTQMRRGVGIPTGVAVAEADLAPRSYITDNNAIGLVSAAANALGDIGTGSNGATDAWGDTIFSEPLFSVRKNL